MAEIRELDDHFRSVATLEAPAATPVARVLVVDDEPRLRQVIVRLMEREGFECLVAGNGREALALMEASPVPLLLTDVSMPEMDGVALLREVRERWPDTAVVMITGLAEVELAVQCLADGAMDFLSKPLHLDELRTRVLRALERRQLLLERDRHHDELERRVSEQAQRLEALFLTSLQSLADALEVKDTYTHGHSLRVSRYSSAIARRLGLPDNEVREIEVGGHLHDIGKIGVREAVLNKPGPLTPDEYEHIMSHPVMGWRLLEPLLRELPHALAVVRSHHERWDGRGLPDGLVGADIPLAARISAVADSFDAMTSDRPYRSGLTLDAAMTELRRCAGTQYDPEVVAAFVAAVEEGEVGLEG